MPLSLKTTQICRTCRSKNGNMTCVFNTCEFVPSETRICDAIVLCASVQIFEGDGLPEQICPQCIDEIKRTYTFRKLCEKSDAELRYELNAPKTSQIDNEDKLDHHVFAETSNIKLESAKSNLIEFTNFEVNKFDTDVANFNSNEAFDSGPENDATTNNLTNPVTNYNKADARYPCNLCQKPFKNQSDLKKHSSTHIRIIDKPPQSPIVGKNNRNCTASKNFVCKICKKEFATHKLWKDHTLYHYREKPYKCSICGQRFRLEEELKEHNERHFQDKLYKCKVCRKKYITPEILAKHVRMRHPTGNAFSSGTNNSCTQQATNGRHLTLIDLTVNEECVNGGVRSTVSEEHKQKPSNDLNNLSDDDNDDQNSGSNNLDDYKKYTNQHDETIDDSRSSKDCVEVETSRCDQQKDMSPLQQLFPCLLCDKRYSTQLQLSRHLGRHKDKDRFLCSVCGKSLHTKGKLDEHHLIHTGEKPHKCDTCKKSFRLLCNLNTHKRIHTGERPYKCGFCDKRFGQWSSRMLHEGCHTEEKSHKCDLCDKAYKFQRNLVIHTRSQHTYERPFQCKQCPKTFIARQYLLYHTRVHTGYRPHMCSVCGDAFMRSTHLSTHMNCKHKQKR